MEAHEVRHRGVQEVEEGGGQDGNVDVLPLEGEHQGGDALCHRHQPLVICKNGERGETCSRRLKTVCSAQGTGHNPEARIRIETFHTSCDTKALNPEPFDFSLEILTYFALTQFSKFRLQSVNFKCILKMETGKEKKTFFYQNPLLVALILFHMNQPPR